MTLCTFQAAGSVELYFYGELQGEERAAVQKHLSACAECRQALEELVLIRRALASRPDVASPPAADWTRFMARLDHATRREAQVRLVAARPWRGVAPGRRYIAYLAVAALLTVVTLSIAYLAQSRAAAPIQDHLVTTAPGVPQLASSDSSAHGERSDWTPEAAFASLSEQHFERSKLVVLGLANRDAEAATGDDWAYERQLAASLLSDTRIYRLAAEEQGMRSLARVMGDLELVLLQTSLSEEPDSAALEQIQHLIRKRELVTKMQVVKTAAGL